MNYGVYINTKSAPFVRQILDLEKSFETRTRNMLKDLVGERVYIIETGHGTPMVAGRATIASVEPVPYENEKMRESAKIIGTPYDIKPGSLKWFYKLENVEKLSPVPVPDNRVNHGRSYTAWNE